MSERAIVTPGDLGRRVTHRRRELGLSRQQVARRAGMAPEYVRYLEQQPARLSVPALLRLANALETSSDALLGGEVELPPGGARDAARPVLHELDRDECWQLLAAGGVGRIAVAAPSGPEVLPVNFTLVDDSIVFRTNPQGTIAAHVGTEVGFEADHLDEAMRQGWSVLVTGTAERVTDPDLRRRVHPDVHPWAGGERDVYLRIRPKKITGRRIEMV